jgi:chemosensory pili system protein ChpA (sensor histidine kinase/response regulator)
MARSIDREVLAGFIEEALSYLPSIATGIESYAADSTQLEDLAEAYRHAHTIKGASSMVGLFGLSHIAHNLEEVLEDIASEDMAMDDAVSSLLGEALGEVEAYLEGVLNDSLEEGPILAEANRIFRRIRSLPEDGDDAALEKLLADLAESQQTGSGDQDGASGLTDVTTMYDEVPPELLEVFTIEAEDHLRNISTRLAALEKEPDQSDHVQDLRRTVHTLKGAAGAVGFHVVSQLAHRMEDLLDQLYQGALGIDADTLNLLYTSTDILQDLASGEADGESLQETLDTLYATYSEHLEATPVQAGAIVGLQLAETGELSDPGADVPEPSDKLVEAERATISPTPKSGDVVRVPLVKLDDLVKLVSELVINRSTFEQRMSDFIREVEELKLSSERLSRVSLNLESKYEASALGGGLTPFGVPIDSNSPTRFESSETQDFDDLEFDRYTEFHLLSRELVETASDIRTIGAEMGTLIGDFNSILNRQGNLSSEIQDGLMRTRMVPLARLTTRFHRAVRVLSQQQGKNLDLVIEGENTELDKSVLDEMADPLLHLLRNAVDHGIEPSHFREGMDKPERGSIILRAFYEGNQVVVQVSDDGIGMDPEKLRSAAIEGGFITEDQAGDLSAEQLNSLVFLPGFTTAGQISEVSGRGVGLDVVRTSVQKLKGSVTLASDPGQGTTFTIRLPMTMAVMQALLVRANNEEFAIPRSVVVKIVRVERDEIDQNGQEPVIHVEEDEFPIVRLGQALDLKQPSDDSRKQVPVLILDLAEKKIALVVDHIVGGREIVVKSLGSHASRIHGVAGATLMGDGRVVLIINPSDLILDSPLPDAGVAGVEARVSGATHDTLAIMIVDDSLSVRRVVSNLIRNAGWAPMAAKDGLEALEIIQRSAKLPDLILVDIEMPRMDGYELMSTLKANEAYQNIPLVVLTSRAGEKHRTKAIAVGASEYVVKPYQDEALVKTIEQLAKESQEELSI